ncbi:MAG: glutathione S-transferase family protein [Proteobacteria bacterium]|nr:glutathione S-transferase family protein [Pseudomonadota bacterium]
MITLNQFPPAFNLPNASPFCMKLELYLRMAGLPYSNRYTLDLHRAPKGKFPWIADEETIVADSGLIIDYLKGKYGDPLDGTLNPLQRAQALVITRLFEDHLYWALLHDRWMAAPGWEKTRPAFFGSLPWPLRIIVPLIARRGVRAELQGHGMGRHTPEQIHALGVADIDALATLLGNQTYFLGEHPTSTDAVAAAFLANILMVPFETPIKSATAAHSNLSAYCQRMAQQYFPAG